MEETTTSVVDWSQIWIITGVGYTVVFLALLMLMLLFKSMPRVLNLGLSKKIREVREKAAARRNGDTKQEKYISGEVSAAIGLALTLYFKEQHDEESGIITIKRVARTYSPWSSKIYGVNNNPR
ncbi:OadG family transporter subunit [Salinimicrobium sp. TH3]|uniref:OadG family transporter subunit n=1 Tax=Salinimicrobium sp. TH3 TaxID=2997342 RepID=UPI002275691D|nr:OadG family transporter subunit [Salinimicrobium sp. TH3]MCY2686428.1 OadG family transporter subunit [Salinimicrobium sp. TH3]